MPKRKPDDAKDSQHVTKKPLTERQLEGIKKRRETLRKRGEEKKNRVHYFGEDENKDSQLLNAALLSFPSTIVDLVRSYVPGNGLICLFILRFIKRSSFILQSSSASWLVRSKSRQNQRPFPNTNSSTTNYGCTDMRVVYTIIRSV